MTVNTNRNVTITLFIPSACTGGVTGPCKAEKVEIQMQKDIVQGLSARQPPARQCHEPPSRPPSLRSHEAPLSVPVGCRGGLVRGLDFLRDPSQQYQGAPVRQGSAEAKRGT